MYSLNCAFIIWRTIISYQPSSCFYAACTIVYCIDSVRRFYLSVNDLSDGGYLSIDRKTFHNGFLTNRWLRRVPGKSRLRQYTFPRPYVFDLLSWSALLWGGVWTYWIHAIKRSEVSSLKLEARRLMKAVTNSFTPWASLATIWWRVLHKSSPIIIFTSS